MDSKCHGKGIGRHEKITGMDGRTDGQTGVIRWPTGWFTHRLIELVARLREVFKVDSGVVAGDGEQLLPPLNFSLSKNVLLVRKFSCKKNKIWGWKSPTLGKFSGRIEHFWAHIISAVENSQLFVGKLWLPVPPSNLF